MPKSIKISLLPIILLAACSQPSSTPSANDEDLAPAMQGAGPSDALAKLSSPAASPPSPAGEDAITADTPITSENYAKVMEARSREYDRLEYKPVNLNGFECGDNCYLELTEATEGSAPRKVLCTARLCADWQSAGRLPAMLRNTGAEAKFGKANQVDGAGDVLARDVEAIVDLRLMRAGEV